MPKERSILSTEKSRRFKLACFFATALLGLACGPTATLLDQDIVATTTAWEADSTEKDQLLSEMPSWYTESIVQIRRCTGTILEIEKQNNGFSAVYIISAGHCIPGIPTGVVEGDLSEEAILYNDAIGTIQMENPFYYAHFNGMMEDAQPTDILFYKVILPDAVAEKLPSVGMQHVLPESVNTKGEASLFYIAGFPRILREQDEAPGLFISRGELLEADTLQKLDFFAPQVELDIVDAIASRGMSGSGVLKIDANGQAGLVGVLTGGNRSEQIAITDFPDNFFEIYAQFKQQVSNAGLSNAGQ